MESSKSPPSQELRLRLFKSQRKSLKRLFRSSVQSAEDADDLLQELAVIVLCHDKVPAEERAFAGWCRVVARHLLLHHFRGARRRREVLLDIGEAILGEASDPQPNAERLVALRELLSSLSGFLDESARELLTQRYVDEETSSEIGSRRDESPAGVRVKLYRLRAVLRKRLSDFDSTPLPDAPSVEPPHVQAADCEIPESTTRPTSQPDLESTFDDVAPRRR